MALPWKKIITAIIHMPCVFQLITGLYCPGCGGTRALKYLLTGHLVKSFCYHPFVLYGAVILVLWLGELWIAKKTGKSIDGLLHKQAVIYVGVAILLMNWMFKNYMLVVKGIDLLPAKL